MVYQICYVLVGGGLKVIVQTVTKCGGEEGGHINLALHNG